MSESSASGGVASIQTSTVGDYRLGLISILAAAVGLLAGLVAYVLYKLIGFITNLVFYHEVSARFRSPEANHLGGWVILVPVIGGLIVGLMAKYGSPKIKGHGIPEAMEAVLTSRSRIEAKVAILKPLSAAIAIGTGGPFGAEGPIIQTGGAFGSLVGQLLSTTAAERKVLLACGAGAGGDTESPAQGVVGEERGERACSVLGVLGEVCFQTRPLGDLCEMRAIRIEIAPGMVKRRQHQRGSRDVAGPFASFTEPAQIFGGIMGQQVHVARRLPYLAPGRQESRRCFGQRVLETVIVSKRTPFGLNPRHWAR